MRVLRVRLMGFKLRDTVAAVIQSFGDSEIVQNLNTFQTVAITRAFPSCQ